LLPRSQQTAILPTSKLKCGSYVGSTLTCTATAAPYTCTWNVPAPPNRTYSLQAKAYDGMGNTGSSSVVNVTSK
jgi:hypothetical protein